ncbi:MAG TPA: dynamin family protein, partial [Vicinamibacteria bacterium]|nr:dynamin family protein [Vicinamibacteria bacterium]
MRAPVIEEKAQSLLAQERALLAELASALTRLEASADDQQAFLRSVRQLDELFLLVVVGEFNAGKSAFINALVGHKVLEEGVTPTTTRVASLVYGEAHGRHAGADGLEVVTAPVPLLRDIHVVDTPGTNAVIREHEVLTREFVPRSDLVLFVTSADRPFTESERSFLASIREWGKKIVFVVNKKDILAGPAELAEVTTFVADNAQRLTGVRPQVFAVTARQAQRAKEAGDAALLAESGFEALEKHLSATLDEKERLRLKLLNPLGVGGRLAEGQAQLVESRLDLLREDIETVESIDRQLELYREDLARDFRYRLSDVERVLLEFERRGMDFFDETLRIGRVFDLVSRSKLRRAFERDVLQDLPQQVERRVEEVIGWMVASDMRQWRGVTEMLERRRIHHAERLVGQVTGVFEHDRDQLLVAARREALRAVETYDRDHESERLASTVQAAVAGTAALQVSALGLGTIVTVLASSAAVDVTGILAAGSLSVLGLLVLPARRSGAKTELREKVEQMRVKLMGAL